MPASTKINIDLALNTRGFRPLGRINGQLGEFEKSLDASNARVLAFGASAGAILAVKKAFTATVKAAIEVEKSLKDINVILQVTSGNLKKFGSDLFKIASDTGQAFSVAAEAATELARQGLGVEETLKRTRDALILARLSGMEAAEAVNALTAALNTFTKVGLDSTAIINKMANVDAAFAVSSDDLAKALGRVGAAAVSAGVDLDQLLAIVTTAQQKTARGGAVIGNSFKTIFTRIQRPRVIKQLESLGVQVRGLEGDTLPAIKVLTNLAKQFDVLTQAQQAQITELVGGVFQVNILKAAMSDLGKEQSIYNRALGISIGSTDQAIRRNEELNLTLSAQFQRTLNTFKEAAAELGTLTLAPALENIFGAVNKTFESAASDTKLAEAGQFIGKSVFEAIGKFIGGPGLIIIGGVLFKTFANLATFAADAFKTLTGLNQNFQTQLNLQKQIFGVLSENPDLMNKIKNGTMSVEDAHQMVLGRINEETLALDRQLLISQQIAGMLTKGGVGFSGEFGAVSKGGGTRKFGGKARSGGFVPSFAKQDELMGMMANGYSGSQIANPKIRNSVIHNGSGGAFSAFTNGHEKIVDFTNSKGKKSTAVIPPKGTPAYDEFMKAFSGGFVPNFAMGVKALLGVKKMPQNLTQKQLQNIEDGVASGKVGTWKTGNKGADKAIAAGSSRKAGAKRAPGAKGTFSNFPVGQGYGVLSLFGNKNRGAVANSTMRASTKGITRLSGLKAPKTITLSGFQSSSFLGGLKQSNADNDFGKLIKKHMSQPLRRVAGDFSKDILGNDAPKVAHIGRKGGPLFPPGAEGSIFETTINALTKDARSFERSLHGDPSAIWDFEEGGNVTDKFKKGFGFTGALKRADAKRSVSREAMTSLANKVFSTAAKGGPGSQKINQFVKSLAPVKKGKAGGYIPNFNSLFNAVQREKAAGIPMGRIRVGSSPSLSSGRNPMGLGVYNTLHEPGGLSQGIRRSLASGRNPRSAGVPNFAEGDGGGMTKNTDKIMKLTMGIMGLQMGISTLKNSINDETKTGRQVISGLEGLEKALMTMGAIAMAGEFLPKGVNAFMSKSRVNPLSGSMAGKGNPFRGQYGFAGKMERADKSFSPGQAMGAHRLGAGRRAGMFTPGQGSFVGQQSGVHRLGGKIGGALGRGWQGTKNLANMPVRDAARRVGGGRGRAAGGATRAIGGAGRGVMKGAASMGAMGTAAVGVGVYMGVSHLANETFNESAQEMKSASKNFELVSQEAEKNIGALTKFGAAADMAAEVFYDSSATMGQVIRAQEEMRKAAEELPIAIRSKIAGLIDPAQINAIIEEGLEAEGKKKQGAQARKDTAQAIRDIRITDFGMTGGKSKEDRIADQAVMGGVARTAIGTLSDKQMNAMSSDDLIKLTEVLNTGEDTEESRKDVRKQLENLGLDPVIIASFTQAMKEGDYEAQMLTEAISDEIIARRKSAQEEKALKPLREALIKQQKEASLAIKDMKDGLKLEQKIRKETIKISSKAAGAFLTDVGKINLAVTQKMVFAGQERQEQFGDTISAGTKALGKTQLGTTALGQGVAQTLRDAASGGIGSVDKATIEKQTAALRAQAETASGAEKKALETLESQLENLLVSSDKLAKEGARQTYETMKLREAQVKAARQQQRLQSFGGAGAILDPSSLDSTINKITAAESAMGITSRAGSKTGFNRAQANKFAGMQELFGGQLPEHMRKKAIASASQVKMADMRVMNKRFGMGMSEEEMKKSADEQAASLFKGDSLDRNNKNLESLDDTILNLIKVQQAAIDDRVFMGSMETAAAQQQSEAYRDFKENQEGKARVGASRENSGLAGYSAAIREQRSAEGRYDWDVSTLWTDPFGSEYKGARKNTQFQRGQAQQLGADNSRQSSATDNRTTVILNGVKMGGDKEFQRRTKAWMQYMAQQDAKAAAAFNRSFGGGGGGGG